MLLSYPHTTHSTYSPLPPPHPPAGPYRPPSGPTPSSLEGVARLTSRWGGGGRARAQVEEKELDENRVKAALQELLDSDKEANAGIPASTLTPGATAVGKENADAGAISKFTAFVANFVKPEESGATA